MGIAVGVPHGRVDPGDEAVGDGVLQDLGLVVDLVTAVAEFALQVGLEQSVPADHLEREQTSLVGQGDVPVGGVQDESLGDKSLHGLGGGGPALAQFGRQGRQGGPAGLPGPGASPFLEVVDLLQVVLRPVGEFGDMHGGKFTRGHPALLYEPSVGVLYSSSSIE